MIRNNNDTHNNNNNNIKNKEVEILLAILPRLGTVLLVIGYVIWCLSPRE